MRTIHIQSYVRAWTIKSPSSDDAFKWPMAFSKFSSSMKLQNRFQDLVEEIPSASTAVREAVRSAYVNFMAAFERISLAPRQSDTHAKGNLGKQAHVFLERCVGYLSDAIQDDLKGAAAGLNGTPPALLSTVGISENVKAEMTEVSHEEPGSEDQDDDRDPENQDDPDLKD